MAGTPTYDDGGSIVTPGQSIQYLCKVQVDSASQAMLEADGFTDTDVRLIVLAPWPAGGS